MPVSVSDAVLSRLARLTPAARAVVELISVVPGKTELWLLNESISPTTAVLEECVDAGILRADNSSIGFRHELARRAVEDSLPAPRAQSMHAKVLQALLSRGADSQLARVVHHAAKSGDAAAVLEYAPIAARQAAALHRPSRIRLALPIGFEICRRPAARTASRLARTTFLRVLCDRTNQRCLEARLQALKIWQQTGNKIRQGDNLRWMSRFAWYLGRNEQAEAYACETSNNAFGITSGEPGIGLGLQQSRATAHARGSDG